MDIRKIKKYAHSLIKVADELDYDIKNITKNLSLFKSLVREVPQLRYLLLSKRIPLESKLSTINDVFQNHYGQVELQCIIALLENGHIRMINDIIDRLNILIQSDSNFKKIHVISSKQLDEEGKNEIIQSIKGKFNINKFSETTFSIDEKMLGGIKIRIGNKIIDGSVSTKLKKIKESLLSI